MTCLIAPKIGNLLESLVAPQGIDCASWVKGQVTKQFQVPSCRDSLLWCWAAVGPRSQDRCPSKKRDTGQTEQLKTDANASESNELSVIMRLDYLWQENLAKAPGSHPPPSVGQVMAIMGGKSMQINRMTIIKTLLAPLATNARQLLFEKVAVHLQSPSMRKTTTSHGSTMIRLVAMANRQKKHPLLPLPLVPSNHSLCIFVAWIGGWQRSESEFKRHPASYPKRNKDGLEHGRATLYRTSHLRPQSQTCNLFLWFISLNVLSVLQSTQRYQPTVENLWTSLKLRPWPTIS